LQQQQQQQQQTEATVEVFQHSTERLPRWLESFIVSPPLPPQPQLCDGGKRKNDPHPVVLMGKDEKHLSLTRRPVAHGAFVVTGQ